MANSKFKRLGQFYLLALGAIALSVIISQFLIQTFISRQSDDSRVINVAGRQRMLSQKISKVSLQIANEPGKNLDEKYSELKQAIELWKKSHYGLLFGDEDLNLHGKNSSRIREMFKEIEPHFNAIVENADAILNETQQSDSINTGVIQTHVDSIISHEKDFLLGMDRIVFAYDDEARTKVQTLRETELWLFVLSLLVITLELIFVFRPLANNISATVQNLMDSEMDSKKLASELSKLYEELGRSYQDLEAVNIHPASPAIFASMDMGGRFDYFSKKLKNLMEYDELEPHETLRDLLVFSGYDNEFYSDLMNLLAQGKQWSGEIKLITENGDFIWIETFIIPVKSKSEIKMIARDVTELKEAKIRSREINRERIERSVKEQNYRSVLILEGQEEERKRLSRELHDGVGQMLSAMKLLLESITPSSKPMQMRMDDAKGLMKSIIQEVRRVSFNLTPSSLDDFGLVPAVNKFCNEIDLVAKPGIHFVNETKFINRMESHTETNLYRIVQEAVNNALKYAKASNITVKFYHTVNKLNIEVFDDGKGFDYDRVHGSGHFDKAGHGIFNMRERAAFIGAIFNLETEPGKGTKITLTLTLE
ncbi:type IV pili methyl-accepting chemotaxis transducer N-terminal domain-containing protein [Marinoscillum sp. MHG1-6]|uniref:sensor histidine kinase n=1 Tax=Marinoscillum sp. MHG1-6 TaxID=2959627 RepID=UPI002157E7B2|nr:type IV pili methyl-accepting chemotaxis transducer N-terminal domain-containing protein [Marinoscillum sp. MHG1-6]